MDSCSDISIPKPSMFSFPLRSHPEATASLTLWSTRPWLPFLALVCIHVPSTLVLIACEDSSTRHSHKRWQGFINYAFRLIGIYPTYNPCFLVYWPKVLAQWSVRDSCRFGTFYHFLCAVGLLQIYWKREYFLLYLQHQSSELQLQVTMCVFIFS